MKSSDKLQDEAAERGDHVYERKLRSLVETRDNIGKMIIIDVESGDYEIDKLGVVAARILQARHPNSILYGKRIGYDVADSIGGAMERTAG